VFDFEVGVKFNELLIYKKSAISSYDSMRYAISAYNVFPYELLDLLFVIVANGLASIHFVK